MTTHYGLLLEMFYYVGLYRGPTEAAKRLGMHQTTLSTHMLNLEELVGSKLYERVNFSFTPGGRKLFERIRPTFEDFDEFLASCRDGQTTVRIAASELIQRKYMLEMLVKLEEGLPGVKLRLTADCQAGMAGALQDGNVDIIIGSFDGEPGKGIKQSCVARIPLVLLVPRESPYHRAADLWALGRFPASVVVPAASEGLQRVFFRGLRELGMKLPDLSTAHALPTVTDLVALGKPFGLSLDLPELTDPRVRAIRLPNFEHACVSVRWRLDADPVVKGVVDVLKQWKRPTSPASPAGADAKSKELSAAG